MTSTSKSYTVIVERDPESGWLVGEVVELQGCHTQASNLQDLEANIKEAIALYREADDAGEPEVEYVGTLRVEVAWNRLRLVPYGTLARVAESVGFDPIQRKGSHQFFKRADGRATVIPDHGSQVTTRPLLRKILRDLDLTPDEYHAILDRL